MSAFWGTRDYYAAASAGFGPNAFGQYGASRTEYAPFAGQYSSISSSNQDAASYFWGGRPQSYPAPPQMNTVSEMEKFARNNPPYSVNFSYGMHNASDRTRREMDPYYYRYRISDVEDRQMRKQMRRDEKQRVKDAKKEQKLRERIAQQQNGYWNPDEGEYERRKSTLRFFCCFL